MAGLKEIKDFLANDDIAIAGVSRKQKKNLATLCLKELKVRHHNLYPVNPNTDVIDNNKCYQDVLSLPEHVKHLHIVTPPTQTYEMVKQAIEKGITHIWIQQKSDTPEAVKLALDNNIKLIHKDAYSCMLSLLKDRMQYINF